MRQGDSLRNGRCRPWGSPTSHPTLWSIECRLTGLDRHNKEKARLQIMRRNRMAYRFVVVCTVLVLA